MRYYQGNCIDSFDEDGDCLISLFSDVSDFACVEENSDKITREEFLKECSIEGFDIPNKNVIYLHYESQYRTVYMIYSLEEDIHFFFD